MFGHYHDLGGNNSINDYYGWFNHIFPYIKNTQVYRCPSKQWTHCTSGGEVARITNAYLFNYDGCRLKAMASIERPAETMITMDGQNSFVISSTNTRARALSAMGNGLDRHNDGGNIAFCDGHAKWMSRGAIESAIPAAGQWCDFLNITME